MAAVVTTTSPVRKYFFMIPPPVSRETCGVFLDPVVYSDFHSHVTPSPLGKEPLVPLNLLKLRHVVFYLIGMVHDESPYPSTALRHQVPQPLSQ
jgi:hypothetical protein